MDLSIIIVSYNVKDLLRDCLNSIFQNTRRISYEIFVVDNNSSDGSAEMVRSEFANINLIENKENLGFAKANNQAIPLSKGRYILLLNPDTIVTSGALDSMVDFMNNNPDVGMIGPQLVYGDGSIQPSISSFPNIWYMFLRMYGFKSLLPKWAFSKKLPMFLGKVIATYLEPYTNNKNTREVDFVSGACMMFRRDLIDQIGLLDENFFMYVEDCDWCKRIKNGGWKICYFPKSKIIHFAGQSSGGAFRNLNPEAYKSIYYYFKKHHNIVSFFLVKSIVTSALIFRIVGLFLLYFFNKSKRVYYKERILAYFQILKV